MTQENVLERPAGVAASEGTAPSPIPPYSRWTRWDSLIALAVIALGISAVLVATAAWGHEIYPNAFYGRWFAADSYRVVADMSEYHANRYRVKVHPIFPLLTYPFIWVGTTILGLSARNAIWLFNAVNAGLWLGVLYAIMRHLDCRRLDSTVFTLLAGAALRRSSGSLSRKPTLSAR